MTHAGGATGQQRGGAGSVGAGSGGAGGGRGRPLHLQRFASVEAFLGVASPFLADREAEHNLIFGVCHNLLTNPEAFAGPPYLAVVTNADNDVVACAMQTPPWQLILSEIDDSRAIELLVEDRLADPPDGVLGPTNLVASYAHLMADRTGLAARLAIGERIFQLTALVPPRRANGAMRPARPTDRGLLLDWLTDFTDEALAGETHHDLEGVATRFANGEGRRMQLWLDNGIPVSMCGVGSPTPHGVRIGPVFTPADMRGRGYASNLVARACEVELDAGRRYCFLFTDRSNPTANHIYQSIGFEPVTDVDRWVFA
ncbi:MAG TPA: GNAT family N-acetyltransferase [Candidatus Limnocylindrales bacterium]